MQKQIQQQKPVVENSQPEQKVKSVPKKKSNLLIILIVTLIIAIGIGIYFLVS
ncbi:hypothetical protein KAJ87_02410 [Candidatus Pacearchaeota archaeon]|nr:hypothetical protein [Candidatus Pacearchaeota archaeon]